MLDRQKQTNQWKNEKQGQTLKQTNFRQMRYLKENFINSPDIKIQNTSPLHEGKKVEKLLTLD